MATLLLSAAGAAAGGAIGGTFLGISAATLGQTLGSVIGSQIDNLLFSPNTTQKVEGQRLSDSRITSSTEGSPIWRGYGRFVTAGNMIWATRLLEEIVVDKQKQGGKGGPSQTVESAQYNYYANFAVGLCEGRIQDIGRIWFDGKLADLTDVTYRVKKGGKNQNPDSLIETKEGTGNAPAYRDLAYIVFENLPINKYGNRIPQVRVEVTRPIERTDEGGVGNLVKGVDLIPGTTEFGYDPEPIDQVIYGGELNQEITERRRENNHGNDADKTDWDEALDQLEFNLPNCGVITLVVTWFGTDLRIGNCQILPKVENHEKVTDPHSWVVAGLEREDALIVSEFNNVPAFGGTPNDASVIRAIQDLKARGFEVMFYPFIIMDIPADNTLPDPYSNNAGTTGQSVYPWRGRITCSPAAGFTGSVDKTATAGTQVSNFVGTAAASDFSTSGTTVSYTGPDEWTFRRFILHYAHLCDLAGGVDQFCIGTEMVGPTTVRSNASTYPFVDALVTLAADVSGIMGSGTEVGYAADWSEYHSHRPTDGTGDVYFNMDPLWSSAHIDFIGIDNYLPLSDWRDGDDHLDFAAGNKSIYDTEYLKSNVEGGEYYDWFYASDTDRGTQTRTNITDGAHSKPWVFRQKDIKSWWQENHVNRPGGTESGGNTSWTPESKPIYFTEYGCPAVDKGPNQPNVFVDPKSSESFFPHFSSGARDDDIQRQYIRAMVEYWEDNSNNPASSVYSGRMIDKDKLIYWSYDARPWPTFPTDGDSWADQPNWEFGHWINGRIDAVYVPDLLAKLAEEYDLPMSTDFARAYGSCDGFVLQQPISFRDAVEPLASLFMFDVIESGAELKAQHHREVQSVATLTLDNLLDQGENESIIVTRRQESELPAKVSVRFIDIFAGYEPATVSQLREVVNAESESTIDTPVVIDHNRAQQLTDRLLYSAWARNEMSEMSAMPRFLFLEPGDVVTLDADGFSSDVRLQSVTDGEGRALEAQSFDLGIFAGASGGSRTTLSPPESVVSAALIAFMDLPLLTDADNGHQPYVASYVNPWPTVNVFKSVTNSNYGLDTALTGPASLGETTSAFEAGPTGRWDYANTLGVTMYDTTPLESLDESAVLNGENAMAIENSQGEWEIFQFVNKTLTGSRSYTLSKLLRGQNGTEDNIEASIPAGARVVFLNTALKQLGLSIADIGRSYFFKYGPGNKDIGDDTYLTTQKSFTARGLKPYSPVHIRGASSGSDIVISWVRRTRIGGDVWDNGDVALSESTEKYEVDVLNGSDVVVRTLTVTSATQVTYTAAQMASDGIVTPFDVIVYQIGETVGRGIGRRATING